MYKIKNVNHVAVHNVVRSAWTWQSLEGILLLLGEDLNKYMALAVFPQRPKEMNSLKSERDFSGKVSSTENTSSASPGTWAIRSLVQSKLEFAQGKGREKNNLVKTAELCYLVFHGENVHVWLYSVLAELSYCFLLKYSGINKGRALNVHSFCCFIFKKLRFCGLV